MTQQRHKILLLDNGKEWGGGTNSMLELLKRIDRQRFDITCCFYYNYTRGEGETIEKVLKSIQIEPLRFSWRVFCLSDQAATSRSFSEA